MQDSKSSISNQVKRRPEDMPEYQDKLSQAIIRELRKDNMTDERIIEELDWM